MILPSHTSGFCLGLVSEFLGCWLEEFCVHSQLFRETLWRVQLDPEPSPGVSSDHFLWTGKRKYNVVSEKAKPSG